MAELASERIRRTLNDDQLVVADPVDGGPDLRRDGDGGQRADQVVLLQVRRDPEQPPAAALSARGQHVPCERREPAAHLGSRVKRPRRGELVVNVVVVVQTQPDLLHVVGAFHPVRGLPDLLHGGQKQANQDCDNGNDDEQFDQRKRRSVRVVVPWRSPMG